MFVSSITKRECSAITRYLFATKKKKNSKTQGKEFNIQHTKITTLVRTYIYIYRLIGRLMGIVLQRIAEFSATDANDLEEFKKFG